MKTSYIFITLSLLTLQMKAQKFSTQNGGHCYTLDIPNYLMKTYDLNDNATLQYQNIVKEAYTIVIEDSKEELKYVGMLFLNPKEFLESFISEYQIDMKNRSVSRIKEFTENNNKHAQLEITWTDEEIDFFMIVTTVETNTHFYKILCWTTDQYKNVLKEDYLNISKSLKD